MTLSKTKGSSYERFIANLLTEHLAPLNFQRSPSSGAFLGGVNKHRTAKFNNEKAELLTGDVYCSNEPIRFNIECKNYSEVPSFHHLFNDNCIIYKWFEESSIDAKGLHKRPILFMKWNRTPSFVVLHTGDCAWEDGVIIHGKHAIMTIETFLANVTCEFFRI